MCKEKRSCQADLWLPSRGSGLRAPPTELTRGVGSQHRRQEELWEEAARSSGGEPWTSRPLESEVRSELRHIPGPALCLWEVLSLSPSTWPLIPHTSSEPTPTALSPSGVPEGQRQKGLKGHLVPRGEGSGSGSQGGQHQGWFFPFPTGHLPPLPWLQTCPMGGAGHVDSILDTSGPCRLAQHQGKPERGALPRALLTCKTRPLSSTLPAPPTPPSCDSPWT